VKSAEKAVIFAERRRSSIGRRISVAPMMDWTDRHCRYFLRGFAADTLLYTEMITTGAVLRGDREKLLRFDPEEHPVALQLGGSEPAALAEAARVGAAMGYDEINLNCGCPSDRVHSGAFGACLMLKPALVADCVRAMRDAVRIPVTVKLRIGVVDAHELGGEGASRREAARAAAARFGDAERAALEEFVDGIVAAGCDAVIVHARKAVLGAWSPADNREIPPLRYDVVRELQRRVAPIPVVGWRDARTRGLPPPDVAGRGRGWTGRRAALALGVARAHDRIRAPRDGAGRAARVDRAAHARAVCRDAGRPGIPSPVVRRGARGRRDPGSVPRRGRSLREDQRRGGLGSSTRSQVPGYCAAIHALIA
jgi:tRNA-dihydrouridine synthase